MNQAFVILHLSDTHIGNPKYDQDSRNVLAPLLTDIKAQAAKQSLTPNLIIFNGDLAFGDLRERPISEQYVEAKKFLDDVYHALGTSYEKTPILFVPGNHDINRSLLDPQDVHWILNQRGEEGEQAIYDLMQKNDRPWKRFLEHQVQWFNFVKSIPHQPWKWDAQFYSCWGNLRFGEYSIGIEGLNSSWSCSEKDTKDRIWMGRYQIERSIQRVHGDLKIAVAHHPISWLNSEEENLIRERIETRFHLHLHGHEHSSWIRSSRNHLLVAAGAAYAGSKKPNAYSWLAFDFDRREAKILARRFVNKGAGAWGPHFIPGITDEQGIFHLKDFPPIAEEAVSVPSAEMPDIKYLDRLLAPPPPNPLGSLTELIKSLEGRFYFRWERDSFDITASKGLVYWPVRLREPTPIHAAQTFAAAALQKTGNDIVLWLDDLGNQESNADVFISRVKRWFESVGADASRLVTRSFKEVLSDDSAEHAWGYVQKWLGVTNYLIEDILKVTKLWPNDDDPAKALGRLKERRPRRLLNPAAVWTCLMYLQEQNPQRQLMTLGGYDERFLWKAWHDCASSAEFKIGHLYAPELVHAVPDQGTRPVHMGTTDLAWKSREDVSNAINAALPTAWDDAGNAQPRNLVGWALNGCVLLPRTIRGEDVIGNSAYQYLENVYSLGDWRTSAKSPAIQDLISALCAWFL